MNEMKFGRSGDFIHDEGCAGDSDPTLWECVEVRQNAGEIEYRCRACGAVWWEPLPEPEPESA